MLIAQASNLAAALKAAALAMEKRSNIPVLETMLLTEHRVIGTNMDMAVIAPVDTTGDGSVLLPAKTAKFLAAVTGDITIDGTGMMSRFGDKFPVSDIPADDFPLALVEGGINALLKAEIPLPYLRRALACVSREETRYDLNGVFVDYERKRIVATDGHRLYHAPIEVTATDRYGSTNGPSAILPAPACKTILRLADKADDLVLHTEIGRSNFETKLRNGIRVLSKQIDGTFPDWPRVVPKIGDKPRAIKFDGEAMLSTLKRMLSVTKASGAPGVAISLDKDQILLRMKLENDHEYVQKVGHTGSPNVLWEDIGFNAQYLAEIIGSAREMGAFEMIQSSDEKGAPASDAPATIRGVGVTDEAWVIMPLRV